MIIGSIIRVILGVISIGYGLTAFPFPKEDRHKVDLVIGCVFFILGGLLSIIFNIWWPLPVGVVLGFGVLALFKEEVHPRSGYDYRDIKEIVQKLDNDPQIRQTAQAALDNFHKNEPQRKELVRRLLQEVEELSDRLDRETEEYTSKKERIIAKFRDEEAIALITAKDEQDRARIQKELRAKELVLGKQLEARSAKINAILDELNAKKEEVRQHLDPMTIAILKEQNRSWRDD